MNHQFNNKMAKVSSSAMHNKGLCVLSHIDKRTSDIIFFICSVYGVLFYNKMAKLSSSTMDNKGLCVLSHIGRRKLGVNFLFCSVYDVLRGYLYSIFLFGKVYRWIYSRKFSFTVNA